jgi:PHD/YefM family antitoxin component YafN of YafNO toxin-antitoxin module
MFNFAIISTIKEQYMKSKGIMVGLSLDEIMPITKVARGFNGLVARIREKSLSKAVVVRNNEPEVVILSINEYVDLKEKEQALELMEINLMVQKRGRVAKPDTMSMEEMFSKARNARAK